MKKYDQRGLFDEEIKLEKLTKKGDPLIELNKLVDWEIFRPILNKVFSKDPKGPGGRPPYDYVMMFKILFLQRLYNLSDEQMEYQINDRLSFLRFLDLSLSKDVPDQNTIWLFREKLTKSNTIEKLFKKFDRYLDKKGVIAHKGAIVDASFVEVPRQRNNRKENAAIKNNEIPERWEENQSKMRQKDVNARWMTKNGERHYGYKNHIKVDKKSKIIISYKTTDASVHDSQILEDLINKKDSHHELYADSAYSGKPIKEILIKKNIRNRIHEKGYRGKPLTEKQINKNRKKSKVRVRVEHIFGFIQNSMHGSTSKAIGIERNDGVIGLMNLTYNICRMVQLSRI